MLSVSNYGLSIKHIENPCEEVQISAIKNNGNSIHFIKDPFEKVIKTSLMKII